MNVHNYPGLATHQEEHIAFMEKMVEFCEDAMEYNEALSTELFQYIKDWLDKHILEEDMKYVSFFKGQGVG